MPGAHAIVRWDTIGSGIARGGRAAFLGSPYVCTPSCVNHAVMAEIFDGLQILDGAGRARSSQKPGAAYANGSEQ